MTLLVDTGPLVAAADVNDPAARSVLGVLRAEAGPLIVPAAVTAEADYILGRRLGRPSRLAFLEDLAAERFRVECPTPEEYRGILDLEARYPELDLGVADASIVVLAHRFRTTRLLTFDERHFRAVRPLAGGAFTILPADDS